MEEILSGLLDVSSLPLVTVFVLGLMTAISPCPLATNITAIGFIGKDLNNRNRIFYNGLVYTLGRAVTYTLIAVIIFFGADQFAMSGVFQKYGEKFIGPLLIVIGLFMLDILKINSRAQGNLLSTLKIREPKITGMYYCLVLFLPWHSAPTAAFFISEC